MTDAIKIEKGIPIPSRQGGTGNARFPFADLEVGDSFAVPLGAEPLKMRSNLSNACASWQLRNQPKKLRSRREGDVFRVWRIA